MQRPNNGVPPAPPIKRILNTQETQTRDGVKQLTNIYNQTVQVYTDGGSITVEPYCAGYMFTNLGDVVASVNGMRITPFAIPNPDGKLGDSRSIMLHKLDIYKGQINLAFEAGAGTNPLVEIVQVYYSEGYTRV